MAIDTSRFRLLPPPRLRQMCPTLAYVKEDCCISTLGSMQLKLSAGPVARTPPFQTPPACPPASTSATSTASTTCLPHLPPTLLPPPRPARLLSYSLPAYTTRRGGPVPGGLPLPCPALLLKSPTTDLATLIDAPYDYRKRRRVPRRVAQIRPAAMCPTGE